MHPLLASQSRAAHSNYRGFTSAAFLHLTIPTRECLITSLEYWTLEAAAYRTWRHQISVSPKWFHSVITDDEGREVTGLKSLVMEAEREYNAAKEVAESLRSVLPTREVLIDNESYWDIEAKAWKIWREEAENEWVQKGELKADTYMGGTADKEASMKCY